MNSRTLIASGAIALLVALPIGCSAKSTTPQTPLPAEKPVELSVSAAGTLKNVFERIGPDFEQAHNVKLVYNFAASGVLQKQIEAGAPVDVFASASPSQVASLVAGGYASVESSLTFASNRLVVAVPKGNPSNISDPADLTNARMMATGNPQSTPHGAKAKEWLENQGLWAALEPKFVFGENSAQATEFAARGEVDAAILFASEATGRTDIEVVHTVPADQTTPIRYVAIPLTDSGQAELAQEFIDYLQSADVIEALLAEGFVLHDQAP